MKRFEATAAMCKDSEGEYVRYVDALSEIKSAKVEATIEVLEKIGEYLKYEYEGTYDRSSIEAFFDDKAEQLKVGE